MSNIVDIEESILTQRICEEKSIGTKILEASPIVGLYLCFIWFIYKFISEFSPQTTELKHYVLLGISVLGIFSMTLGFLTMNKLHKSKITNREEVRLIIFEYLEAHKLTIIGRSNRMIIAERYCAILSWGRKWVIIFDGETDVYINCRTLGRHGIELPFYSLSNKRRVKKLMRKFT